MICEKPNIFLLLYISLNIWVIYLKNICILKHVIGDYKIIYISIYLDKKGPTWRNWDDEVFLWG